MTDDDLQPDLCQAIKVRRRWLSFGRDLGEEQCAEPKEHGRDYCGWHQHLEDT